MKLISGRRNLQPARRFGEDRAEALKLAAPAAWHDGQHPARPGQAELSPGSQRVRIRRQFISQRMTDEYRRDLVPVQEIGLERQQAQHLVASLAQHAHPATAPGPHRG
jgi:hypothetical protein